jgi:uncharacterized Fe-S cluster-containing protein
MFFFIIKTFLSLRLDKMNTLQYSKDPADCCLDLFYENPNYTDFKKESCPEFMAQRCARNWDSKCDMYLVKLDDKRDGNSFVRDVASKRYCRGSNNDKNSSCVTSCENDKCSLVKDDIYKNPVKLYEFSKNFGSLKDNQKSPLKAGECKKVCDILNLSSFEDNDRVLNECLDRGSCGDIMMNLSENIVYNNIPYKNRRLKKFINGYIAEENTNLQTRVLVGGKGPQVTSRPIETPGPAVTIPIKQKQLPRSVPSVEGYNSQEQQGVSTTSIVIALLFLAFIIGGGYKMYKKYRKY